MWPSVKRTLIQRDIHVRTQRNLKIEAFPSLPVNMYYTSWKYPFLLFLQSTRREKDEKKTTKIKPTYKTKIKKTKKTSSDNVKWYTMSMQMFVYLRDVFDAFGGFSVILYEVFARIQVGRACKHYSFIRGWQRFDVHALGPSLSQYF